MLTGKDPNDNDNPVKTWPVKTWIVVTGNGIEARKLLPSHFEVYEVEARAGDLGGLPGVVGWMGEARTA